MPKRLKFCIVFVILFLFVALYFGGCTNKPKIEGYWISGDEKYSVSFDGNGTIVVDDKYIGEYIVFDENKIAINVNTSAFDEYLDLSMSATYNIVDDMLVIADKEKGAEFLFYTKEKANEIINRAYREKVYNFNGFKEFSSFENLGYFDDNGNLIKSYDWSIDEDEELLYDYLDKVQELFNKEVLAFYQTKSPYGNYRIFFKSLLGIDGTIFYVLDLGNVNETSAGLVNRYAIEPVEGTIYIENLVDGSYELWDGTVAYGRSLLDD